MSRPELQALQLSACAGRCSTPGDNVPHYRHAFGPPACGHPTCVAWPTWRGSPFTAKQDLRDNYPYGLFAVPMAKIVRVHCLVRHHRSPHRGRLHEAGDIERWAAVMARSLRVAGASCGHHPQLLRLRPLHRRPRRPLRWRGARRHGDPDGRRQHREADPAHPGVPPTVIMATPSYMLTLADTMRRMGLDPSGDHAAAGHVRRRAIGPTRCAPRSSACWASTRSTYGLSGSDGPGVACEFVGHKGRPGIWEDHFYPEIIDPVTGECCPTASVASWCSPRSPSRGDAGDPLPHP